MKPGWTAGQVLDILEKRIEHLDQEMHRELEGFPEHYATQVEIDMLRNQIDMVRSDHVARREIEEIKHNQTNATENVRKRLDEQTGRRSATAILISIIATILAVMFGFIWNSQLSSAEVSDQIQREAPWNRDKTAVNRDVQVLQASAARQSVLISQLQGQIRFICSQAPKIKC